nr:hypothetical protein [Tanacetum cinerariifolium]
MSDWGCFGLEHPGGQAGNFILPYIVELQCRELRSNMPPDSYSAASHFGGVTDWYQSQGYREPAMPIPPPLPLTPLSSPLPQIPSPPLSASPPILPIPLPAASLPLHLLSFDRKADRPEVTLPPRKRLSIVNCPGYEAGESSVAAAARPIEGRRADYGFVDSVEVEIKRWRAKDIGYGIRDTWIDSIDVAEEVALMTLKGVNTRVTELAAVQEQDTQDIYGVMEDT